MRLDCIFYWIYCKQKNRFQEPVLDAIVFMRCIQWKLQSGQYALRQMRTYVTFVLWWCAINEAVLLSRVRACVCVCVEWRFDGHYGNQCTGRILPRDWTEIICLANFRSNAVRIAVGDRIEGWILIDGIEAELIFCFCIIPMQFRVFEFLVFRCSMASEMLPLTSP